MSRITFTESTVPAVAKSSWSAASPAEKGRLPTYSFRAICLLLLSRERDLGPDRQRPDRVFVVLAGVRLGARKWRRAVIQPDPVSVAYSCARTNAPDRPHWAPFHPPDCRPLGPAAAAP